MVMLVKNNCLNCGKEHKMMDCEPYYYCNERCEIADRWKKICAVAAERGITPWNDKRIYVNKAKAYFDRYKGVWCRIKKHEDIVMDEIELFFNPHVEEVEFLSAKLDKEDIINLVCGINPSYEQMGEVGKWGTYLGSHDRWTWNKSAIEKESIQNIYDKYLLLKSMK